MSEENKVDDATVVHDEDAEEKGHEELVANVTKMLEEPEKKQPGDEPEEETVAEDESTKEEPSKDEPEPLSRELQTRAERAGISKELAERLYQGGHLEETLTALDRKLIESREPDREPEKEPEKSESKSKSPPEDVPDLDPDVYDEAIVKRDAYHKQRIDALEAKLEELLGDRQSQFDQWFDGVLSEMGYDTADEEKCQKTFKAYCGICEASGVSPESRDKGMVERAHAAMFPEDVVKQTQKKTVDRLRDAEGKFLSSSKPRGAPPEKGATPEEIEEQLVSDVTAYLKKQGVQMSGL